VTISITTCSWETTDLTVPSVLCLGFCGTEFERKEIRGITFVLLFIIAQMYVELLQNMSVGFHLTETVKTDRKGFCGCMKPAYVGENKKE
jgi:hypothetical protein